MSDLHTAAKLALEFVEYHSKYWNGEGQHPQEIATALRQALEQPAQKCSYPYCGCNSKAWCKVERNEALDKMADNAKEVGLDYDAKSDHRLMEQLAQQEPMECMCGICKLGKLTPLTDEQAYKAIKDWCGPHEDDDEPSALDIFRAAHGITKE